ncbi:MAG TPA: cytochrome b/b6 domain-containing protein [Acidimicrobiales bacterium]|nr:cytochrome b/b6 domain-containing protein [Acidimicrobiales bacterium]
MEARRVQRFDTTARLVHWSFTVLFVALLCTGAVVAIPLLSETVGRRELVRRVHITAGLVLLSLPLLVALVGNRAAMRADLREIDNFDAEDWRFLRRRPSRPGRFNGGQKANAIVTATASVLLLVSGVVMWRWPLFPRAWRAGAINLHQFLTVLMIPLVVGHVYLSAFHRSTRHALRGMIGGWVDREWASEHHPRWDAIQAEDPPSHPGST